MISPDLQRRYESLVDRADRAFLRMGTEHPEELRCRPGCSDCCYALFGLFGIEAAYLKDRFDRLERKERRQILLRCGKMDKDLRKWEESFRVPEKGVEQSPDAMGKARIRCPLLEDDASCALYPYRPITCRVYGIPTRIDGKARVCGKSGFKKGESYPTFDLDHVQRELYLLSRDLLWHLGGGGSGEQASLLISVSQALKAPLRETIRGCSGSNGIGPPRGLPDGPGSGGGPPDLPGGGSSGGHPGGA